MAIRTIRVKNASILATVLGRDIDFEVRDNKSCKGFTLLVDGMKLIDCSISPYDRSVTGKVFDKLKHGFPTVHRGEMKDGDNYNGEKALFRIRDIADMKRTPPRASHYVHWRGPAIRMNNRTRNKR